MSPEEASKHPHELAVINAENSCYFGQSKNNEIFCISLKIARIFTRILDNMKV